MKCADSVPTTVIKPFISPPWSSYALVAMTNYEMPSTSWRTYQGVAVFLLSMNAGWHYQLAHWETTLSGENCIQQGKEGRDAPSGGVKLLHLLIIHNAVSVLYVTSLISHRGCDKALTFVTTCHVQEYGNLTRTRWYLKWLPLLQKPPLCACHSGKIFLITISIIRKRY